MKSEKLLSTDIRCLNIVCVGKTGRFYDLLNANAVLKCLNEHCLYLLYLQVQIQMQVGVPQPDPENTTPGQEDDDIDAALKDLQESLEGNSINSPGDITHIPELGDYVKFFK